MSAGSPDRRLGADARPEVVVFDPMPCSDLVVPLAAWPERGDKVLAVDVTEMDGGVSANFAVAAARLGATVHVFGWAGSDRESRTMLTAFQAEGIDTAAIRRRRGAAVFRTIVLVGPDGERSVVLVPPARLPAALDPAWASTLEDMHPALTYVGPWDGAAALFAGAADRAGGVLAATLESGTAVRDLRELARVSILFLSREAAASVGWDPRRPDHMPEGWRHGPAVVVVTLGVSGSRYWRTAIGRGWSAPAPETRALDATGAGDAYAAAFCLLWLQGVRGEALLAGANAAGAVAVTGRGPRGALASPGTVAAAVAEWRHRARAMRGTATTP